MSTKTNQGITKGWVVAAAAGSFLLILAMVWTILPWPAALMASAAAFMGYEFGMVGARWADDREKASGEATRT